MTVPSVTSGCEFYDGGANSNPTYASIESCNAYGSFTGGSVTGGYRRRKKCRSKRRSKKPRRTKRPSTKPRRTKRSSRKRRTKRRTKRRSKRR